MRVYIVVIIYPYDGMRIDNVYLKEEAAKQRVKLLNKDLDPQDEIDEYAKYYTRELKPNY